MSKLIKLPNGNCIDPDAVIEIKAFVSFRSEITGEIIPDRVVITGDWYLFQEIRCESSDVAQSIIDEIFLRCNEARSD